MSVAVVEAPPRSVRAATASLVLAVGAGVVEAVGHTIADGVIVGQLVTRGVIYVIVLSIVAQFWRGRQWARLVLGFGLGVLGTLSLILEPLISLVAGDPVGDINLATVGVIVIRGAHVLAVWVACYLMVQPDANAYFRRRPAIA